MRPLRLALACCCACSANAALLPPSVVSAQKASSTLPDPQLSRIEGWTLLCDRLQAGDSATGLERTLSTAAGREGFFGVYLSDPAYTVADAAPPVALIDAIIGSRTQSVASVSACLAIVAIAYGREGACYALREAGAAAAIEGARGDIVNERNKTYPDRALAALAGS